MLTQGPVLLIDAVNNPDFISKLHTKNGNMPECTRSRSGNLKGYYLVSCLSITFFGWRRPQRRPKPGPQYKVCPLPIVIPGFQDCSSPSIRVTKLSQYWVLSTLLTCQSQILTFRPQTTGSWKAAHPSTRTRLKLTLSDTLSFLVYSIIPAR